MLTTNESYVKTNPPDNAWITSKTMLPRKDIVVDLIKSVNDAKIGVARLSAELTKINIVYRGRMGSNKIIKGLITEGVISTDKE